MKKKSTKEYFIYGKHCVTQSLLNPERKIYKIYTILDNHSIIPDKFCDIISIINPQDFSKFLPKNAVHQNIAIQTSELHNKKLESTKFSENSLVVALDQITDPQNLGSILRNAASFGVDAIIIPEDNAIHESGAVAKAASGALELVNIYKVKNMVQAIKYLKKIGFWITALDGKALEALGQKHCANKSCLVLGAEGSGIRRLVLENCDMKAKIDIAPVMESLNVAATSAICFYEASKSRHK